MDVDVDPPPPPIRYSLSPEPDENPEDEEPRTIVDFLLVKLNELYQGIKAFPQPFDDREPTNGSKKEEIFIEEWEDYKLRFFQTLVTISNYTNPILRIAFDIYTNWLNHGSKAFGELLAVHDDLNEETIETIHKQCRCILICMEEYFLLAHFYMPSWRILTATSKTKIPMEIPFFYELCRIRAITDIFTKFRKYFQKTVEVTSETNTFMLLNALELLPPNLSKWIYPFGVVGKSKTELMVPYYSLSQLESSFRILFLKVNHVGYHSDIGNYVEELLYRASWLAIGPQTKEVMNVDDLTAPLGEEIISELDDNFLWSGDEESNSAIIAKLTENSGALFISNRNFTYRLILRYYAILSKTAYRSFIFVTKRYRGIENQNIGENGPLFSKLPKMSAWVQEWLNWKFGKVHLQMRTEVFNYYSSILIPPSDKEWVIFRYPLQYISDNSVWTIMYDNLKEFMTKTANKDIKKLFQTPTNTEGTVVEYIILRLMTMNFASSKFDSVKFDFMKFFVVSQDALVEKIQYLKERKMPTLVQSFNRYCLLHQESDKPVMYEFQSIYDTLAAWLLIMISKFPKEAVTFTIINIIQQARQELARDHHSKNKGTEKVKTNQFSTVQTRTEDRDEENEDGKSTFF